MSIKTKVNEDRFRVVEALFLKVRNLPEQERNEAIEKATVEIEIKSDVKSLLAHGDATVEFMKTPPDDSSIEGIWELPAIPEKIGDYRILEVLGEGGFGVVYLAERREPYKERVALKLIQPGMHSKKVLARFRAEQQALALMNHPNIAQIRGAGMTPEGQPFFVMEYVQGEPITEFCDRLNLTTRQRLELFIPICEAIQHAHHKGVVHRDIKPSNVLVGVSGDEFVPKIIDFGIAKALNYRLIDDTQVTEHGHGKFVGTPEYMSPEQAENRTVDVDTRTDVYSLGVMLYELLSGALPFDPASLRNVTREEVCRILRDVDPPTPSTRLSRLGLDGREIARHRQTQIDALAKELRSELEWIPMMAMRKDRTHRYRTATEMADDLRNYLEGKPLIAGPEAGWYRIAKVVRRHKPAMITGLLVALALVVGLISTSAFAIAAHRAANREREQRELADRAIILVHEIASLAYASDVRDTERDAALDYVITLFDTVARDPGTSPERLEKIALASTSMGDLFGGIRGNSQGDHEEALTWYQFALTIRRGYSESHPDDAVAQMRWFESQLRVGDAHKELNAPLDALDAYQNCERIAMALLADTPEDIEFMRLAAIATQSIGDALLELRQTDGAESKFHESLELRTRILEHKPNDAEALRDQSTALIRVGYLWEDSDPALAKQHYDRAVDIRSQLFDRTPEDGRARRDYAWALYRWAFAAREVDGLEVALPAAQEAFDIYLRLYEEELSLVRDREGLYRSLQQFTWFLNDAQDADGLIQAVRAVANLYQEAAERYPMRAEFQSDLEQLMSELERLEAAVADVG